MTSKPTTATPSVWRCKSATPARTQPNRTNSTGTGPIMGCGLYRRFAQVTARERVALPLLKCPGERLSTPPQDIHGAGPRSDVRPGLRPVDFARTGDDERHGIDGQACGLPGALAPGHGGAWTCGASWRPESFHRLAGLLRALHGCRFAVRGARLLRCGAGVRPDLLGTIAARRQQRAFCAARALADGRAARSAAARLTGCRTLLPPSRRRI